MPSTSVYVNDFGVVADGVTNDLPAFQAALNYTASLPRGAEVVLTRGRMRIAGTPTYSGKPLRLVGHGQEVSVISQTTAGAHGLDATFPSHASTGNESIYPLTLEGFTIEAAVGGAGTAIKAAWQPPLGAALQHCNINDINVRSVPAVGISEWWTRGIHLKNAAIASVKNVSVAQFGSNCQDAFWLECDPDAVCFGANFLNLDLHARGNGFRTTGWIEGLNFSNFSMVSRNAMVLDASTSVIPGDRNPLVTLANGHLNGADKAFTAIRFKSIHLVNMNMVANYQSTSSGTDCHCFHAEDCDEVLISNSLLNDVGEPPSLGTLVNLLACKRVIISGNRFLLNQSSAGAQKQAIRLLNDCSNVMIHDNVFISNGSRAGTGIFTQNGATDPKVVVRNNYFENFARSTWLTNPGSSRVEDNNSVNVTTPHAVIGTVTENYRTSGNIPFTRPTLAANDATPSVAGIPSGANVFVSNTAPTTITNLDDGFDSQEITLIPTNGNTTVGHVPNIFLQGSVPFAIPTWGSLTLQKIITGGSTIWIEKGRRS